MENKKNEMLTDPAENVKSLSEAEIDELEFLPADLTVDASTVQVSEPAAVTKAPAEATPKEENEATPETSAEKTEEKESETVRKKEDHSSPKYLFKLVAVLTCICMGVALLLAVVNNITKDKIAENIANQKQEAILEIFPEGTATREYVTDGGETVFIVYKDDEMIGYCVNAVGSGFAGDVEVMVGLDTESKVYGIKIVSMSETPGIGTKVQGESFLGQFIGEKGSSDADIISGATFSSNAVKDAVNYALSVEIDLGEITDNKNAQ